MLKFADQFPCKVAAVFSWPQDQESEQIFVANALVSCPIMFFLGD